MTGFLLGAISVVAVEAIALFAWAWWENHPWWWKRDWWKRLWTRRPGRILDVSIGLALAVAVFALVLWAAGLM